MLIHGGRFEAAVPDAGRYLRAYASGSKVLFEVDKAGVDSRHLSCPMDEIAWFVYMGGQHKSLFDGESILRRLRDAGFEEVALRPFDPYTDLGTRRHESIYVTATKP